MACGCQALPVSWWTWPADKNHQCQAVQHLKLSGQYQHQPSKTALYKAYRTYKRFARLADHALEQDIQHALHMEELAAAGVAQ